MAEGRETASFSFSSSVAGFFLSTIMLLFFSVSFCLASGWINGLSVATSHDGNVGAGAFMLFVAAFFSVEAVATILLLVKVLCLEYNAQSILTDAQISVLFE